MANGAEEVRLVDEEVLLEGLMQLTNNNLGLSHELLKKVIKKTQWEVNKTLQEIKDNIDVETRRARRRAMYALRRNMEKSIFHKTRPKNTASHHIVAWGDRRASMALGILNKWGIQPHDAANGVYLPQYETDTPHPEMPNAISHSRTHTDKYHENVLTVLLRVDVVGATREDMINALQDIGYDLQKGVFPVRDANGWDSI